MSTDATGELTLYHFAGCSFCARVQSALRDLDVTVVQRDIHRDARARATLVEAMGKKTVPVLFIHEERQWLPESAAIVRYLYDRFGEGRSPPLKVWLTPQHLVFAVLSVATVLWMLMR